ncbi:hypothetical protein [Clostridium thailandense]|uniref:hypothetical protein n=1 Tax=Clostridium thailandense TaxID=2794346 RepID=UPI00398A32A3
MYEVVRGLFISLVVGLTILEFQTISNKRKEYFNILTYFKNVSPIVYYNQQVIRNLDKVHKYLFEDEKNNVLKENIEYDFLISYFKFNHEKLLVLPEISNNIMNIKFLDFFLDHTNMKEKVETFLRANREMDFTFFKENQLVLGVYETLFCCIQSINCKMERLEECLNYGRANKQKSKLEENDEIRTLLKDAFVDFEFIRINLNRFDEFIKDETNITYNKLKRVEMYYGYTKYILIILIFIFAMIIIA